MRNRKFTKDSPPLYTSPLNSMPQSSIQSNHPRYARYKSFRNLESFSIVLHRYLTFPSPIVFSYLPFIPHLHPYPFLLFFSFHSRIFCIDYCVRPKCTAEFRWSCFSVSRFFPSRLFHFSSLREDEEEIVEIRRTSEVSQRYFERNMHWREGEKKEGVSLSRPISISRVNRLLEEMTTSSTTSSVSLIAFTFLVKLLNSSLHRSELSTPNSTPFQASFPSNNAPLRVVARQLASDLVRLGLNSQSRCVTRLVECPINPLPSPS